MEAAEESGWTDCFTWEDLFYTGRDLSTPEISTATKRVSPSKVRNYELIATDVTIAKAARECLIADHTAAGAPAACNLKAPQVGPSYDEHQQITKVGVRKMSKFSDGLQPHNYHPCVGASSMVSDASSGQRPAATSSLFPAHRLLKMTTALCNDAALLNAVLIDRATEIKLGGAPYKRVRGAFHGTAVPDTCSKTRRITTQSNLQSSSSSLSGALPPATSSQLQCSAAEASSPAASHIYM